MVVAVAFLPVLMVMIVAMLAVMVVVMVVVLPIIIVVVMVVVLVVMIVIMVMVVSVLMVVIVVVAVALDVLVQLVVEAGVVYGVEHPVPELVLVDVDHGAHEREADLLGGLQGAVVLDAVLEVGEVQGDTLPALVDDRGLDVAEEHARLLGDPLADGQQGLGEPRLGVRVPSGDGPLEALGAAAGLLQGGVLVVVIMVVVLMIVVVVVVAAHLIIS